MDNQYLKIALQYYLAGRSATFAFSMPVAGNLIHHAVEMLLKYLLINRSYSADQLKDQFRHDLNKLWSEVKSIFKDATLNRFDGLISGVNKFEELRYPEKGYQINILIYRSTLPEPDDGSMKTKLYQMCLEDIDEFFTAALLKDELNPEWIKGHMRGDALEQYRKENKHLLF